MLRVRNDDFPLGPEKHMDVLVTVSEDDCSGANLVVSAPRSICASYVQVCICVTTESWGWGGECR